MLNLAARIALVQIRLPKTFRRAFAPGTRGVSRGHRFYFQTKRKGRAASNVERAIDLLETRERRTFSGKEPGRSRDDRLNVEKRATQKVDITLLAVRSIREHIRESTSASNGMIVPPMTVKHFSDNLNIATKQENLCKS